MHSIRPNLWILLMSLGGLLLALPAVSSDIGRDWQLPFVETDTFRAFANTSATVIEYNDGETVRLHAGKRGFPPVYEPPLLFATGLDGQVSAWHVEERRLVWHRQFEGWIFPPLVVGQAVYLTGQPHRLFKLDRDSGSTLASAPLPNEAIYSPLSWRDGHIAVGVYARTWLVLEADTLSETQRYPVPAPAITASPEGFYLSHNGHLYQRLENGEFEQQHTGMSPVRWFKTTDDGFYWSGDRHFLHLKGDRLRCLYIGAQVVHRASVSNQDRIIITNFNGTYRTLQVSQNWGNPDLQADKENNDEKMVNANQLSTDRHHDQLRPC